jgi:outer membrane immunogenic protein
VSSTINTTYHAGWTAGGGLEYAFTDYLSAKAEYLYVALPAFDILIPSCSACAAGSDIVVHHRFSDNIVRGGLNFRFGTAH